MRTSRPQVTAFFDPLAELYARYAEITDDLCRPWLRSAIPDLAGVEGSRAVDLGCGSGRFTGLLADRSGQMLAVDVADGSWRSHARGRVGTRGLRAA
jgi:ubiquinone/menaquinone biosynthesis C-methylase UbiE